MAFKFEGKRIPYYAKGSVDRKPGFRATGRGLAVENPAAKRASSFTGNATMTANITPPNGSEYLEKFHLFVTRVTTAWNLSGETAQTLQSRSFYPRNLQQDDFVIQGICPDQHEYDRLVEFVQAHQLRIVANTDRTYETADQTESVKFRMAPTGRQGTYRHAPKISWDIAITNIAAGHERFQFQPAFTITCKVLNDNLESADDVEFSIMSNLDYANVFTDAFGNLYHPTANGPDYSGALVQDTQTSWNFTGGKADAGTAGGGGGGCDSGAVFSGMNPGETDQEYANRVNSTVGGNFGKGAAPVKFPGPCMGPGSDNQHDKTYMRQEGDSLVDSNGTRYDDKGRVK